MRQAYVQMPLSIMPRTKAAHVLPSATCKATPSPLMAGLSTHGRVTDLWSLTISY